MEGYIVSARKYRPATFDTVIGQKSLTTTLKNAIAAGKLAQAYLFCGPRGVGKTTCARIFAKTINCLHPTAEGEACNECESCQAFNEQRSYNIHELDAASNNSVDDIRQLVEQVRIPPQIGKYKVYIIDEVHMLSTSAFNAFLKTLEEPPRHAIFILATTEKQKILPTILSRCQRFDFKRIDDDFIAARLKYVAECEGLNIDENSARLISGISDGALRDALSILDLCAATGGDITEDTVFNVCSMASNEYLIRLADCIKRKDTEGALTLIDTLHGLSVDMHRLLEELTTHFRDIMIIKTVKSGRLPIVCSASHLAALKEQAESFDLKETVAIIDILRSYCSESRDQNGRITAEMAIIRLTNPEIRNDLQSLELRVAALEAGNANAVAPTIVSAAEAEPNKGKAENIQELERIMRLKIKDITVQIIPLSSEKPVYYFRAIGRAFQFLLHPALTPTFCHVAIQLNMENDEDIIIIEYGQYLSDKSEMITSNIISSGSDSSNIPRIKNDKALYWYINNDGARLTKINNKYFGKNKISELSRDDIDFIVSKIIASYHHNIPYEEVNYNFNSFMEGYFHFSCDIQKNLTLKELLDNFKEENWEAKNYCVLTNNCQDFAAKILKLLKATRRNENIKIRTYEKMFTFAK